MLAARKYDKDPEFCRFKRQLYHASLAAVLKTLCPGMTTPVVCCCPDGHFRRVIVYLTLPGSFHMDSVWNGWIP